MSDYSEITKALNRGLDFLARNQKTDGSFESYSSPTKDKFDPTKTYQTTFVPSIILGSLARLPLPKAWQIRQHLAAYLLTQKSKNWSFNYWAKHSPQRKTHPYPDDLDDTFCALIGLFRHNSDLVDETALANMVRLLVATETEVGGPYKTWLVSEDTDQAWQDVDLAVNANIAYFLTKVSEPLPNLTTFLEKYIKTGDYSSRYYPNDSTVMFYIARAYRGTYTPQLTASLQSKINTKSPLEAALVLVSLIRLGKLDGTEKLVKLLLETQHKDGSWQAEAFCIDPERNGKNYYHGAAALSTAFALKALYRYQQVTPKLGFQKPSAKEKPASSRPFAAQLHEQIINEADAAIAVLNKESRLQAHTMIHALIDADSTREILLFQYMFIRSLRNAEHVPVKTLLDLGLGNLFGWTAYTIYDDFIDDSANPVLLPIANICMRLSIQYFESAISTQSNFRKLILTTFNTIDQANVWEVNHCRFPVVAKKLTIRKLPDYGKLEKLAERSMGHALTPLAILLTQNISIKSIEFTATQSALSNYLVARQLNDDMHDWEADIQNGHISYVVSTILAELQVTGKQPLETLIPAMREQFWNHTLLTICTTAQLYIDTARDELKKVTILKEDHIIGRLLDEVERVVRETVISQRQAKNFLDSYHGNTPSSK